MIQLTFDASTPEEALGHQPTMLSYAQHSGGENAQWDDDNVQREDGHLLTFPGEGSHADYYQSAVGLAWGEDGSGFGCDQSQEELREVKLKTIVVPQTIDPHGPFAWALFQGRWGEYHPWQFKWTSESQPVEAMDEADQLDRRSSLRELSGAAYIDVRDRARCVFLPAPNDGRQSGETGTGLSSAYPRNPRRGNHAPVADNVHDETIPPGRDQALWA